MTRSIWKGPFVDGYLLKKAEAARCIRPQGCDQDLVAPFDHPAAIRGRHLRRLQRPQAYSGAGDRGHGRPQAGRVLAHPHLPRPFARRRRRQESEEGLMGKESRARVLADHQAMAIGRNIRVSPRKLNLVAQQIRGKKVDRALNELTFSPEAHRPRRQEGAAVGHRQCREQPRSRRRRSGRAAKPASARIW